MIKPSVAVPLLARMLATASVGLPHWYFLLVERRPTFFERETTLWLTDSLLLLSGWLLGAFSEEKARSLIAYLMVGVAIGVTAYILLTTDFVPSALSGAGRYKHAGLALASSLVLTMPAVVLGVIVGRGLRIVATTPRRGGPG